VSLVAAQPLLIVGKKTMPGDDLKTVLCGNRSRRYRLQLNKS